MKNHYFYGHFPNYAIAILTYPEGKPHKNPIKSPFSYGFPMVFLWVSYGFPMVSTSLNVAQVEAPLHAPHLRAGALCGGESAGARLATLEAPWMRWSSAVDFRPPNLEVGTLKLPETC